MFGSKSRQLYTPILPLRVNRASGRSGCRRLQQCVYQPSRRISLALPPASRIIRAMSDEKKIARENPDRMLPADDGGESYCMECAFRQEEGSIMSKSSHALRRQAAELENEAQGTEPEGGVAQSLKSNCESQPEVAEVVEQAVTLACPRCGHEIPREDIRPGGFRCPSCKEHLRIALRGGRIGTTVILLLSFFLCYRAEVRGANILPLGLVVFFFLCMFWHSLSSFYWPRIESDPTMCDHFLHIVPPPHRSKKP